MKKFVIVPIKVYIQLKIDQDSLSRLEQAGVDNWSGYEYAFEDYNEEDDFEEQDIVYNIIEENE